MEILVQQPIPRRMPRQPKLRLDVLLKDLTLFASLCLARLIVCRTLLRQRQEEAGPVKRIKLPPLVVDESFKGVSD
jgi:hypothetical protein